MKPSSIPQPSALVTPLPGADPAPATAKLYRIMPIGDSITEGGDTFCVYRYPLWEKLTAAGYRFQYVGSRKSESPVGPLAHEGYGGKNTDFLTTAAPPSFRQHPADIVLLHAGHNFSVEEQPVPKIVAATESMIAEFREANPCVTVLVAQVIHSTKLPKYSYIPALNEALAKMAERLNNPDQPILIVNQAEGFAPATDTIDDKVHPNAQGAEKMAVCWFNALTRILEKPAQNSQTKPLSNRP